MKSNPKNIMKLVITVTQFSLLQPFTFTAAHTTSTDDTKNHSMTKKTTAEGSSWTRIKPGELDSVYKNFLKENIHELKDKEEGKDYTFTYAFRHNDGSYYDVYTSLNSITPFRIYTKEEKNMKLIDIPSSQDHRATPIRQPHNNSSSTTSISDIKSTVSRSQTATPGIGKELGSQEKSTPSLQEKNASDNHPLEINDSSPAQHSNPQQSDKPPSDSNSSTSTSTAHAPKSVAQTPDTEKGEYGVGPSSTPTQTKKDPPYNSPTSHDEDKGNLAEEKIDSKTLTIAAYVDPLFREQNPSWKAILTQYTQQTSDILEKSTGFKLKITSFQPVSDSLYQLNINNFENIYKKMPPSTPALFHLGFTKKSDAMQDILDPSQRPKSIEDAVRLLPLHSIIQAERDPNSSQATKGTVYTFLHSILHLLTLGHNTTPGHVMCYMTNDKHGCSRDTKEYYGVKILPKEIQTIKKAAAAYIAHFEHKSSNKRELPQSDAKYLGTGEKKKGKKSSADTPLTLKGIPQSGNQEDKNKKGSEKENPYYPKQSQNIPIVLYADSSFRNQNPAWQSTAQRFVQQAIAIFYKKTGVQLTITDIQNLDGDLSSQGVNGLAKISHKSPAKFYIGLTKGSIGEATQERYAVTSVQHDETNNFDDIYSLLHEITHLFGLHHVAEGTINIMSPYKYSNDERCLEWTQKQIKQIREKARQLTE